ILRAPLAKEGEGFGLALCRDRKVDPRRQRIHLLWRGYAHAVQPPETFPKRESVPDEPQSDPVVSFAFPADPNYQAMLSILRDARENALADPRVDMPGAQVIAGACRTFLPPPVPKVAPSPVTALDSEGVVHVSWERSAETIGLEAELHRSASPAFTPDESTQLVRTGLSRFTDREAPAGPQHYALVLVSALGESQPSYATVEVPPPAPPMAPGNLTAQPVSSAIRLRWEPPTASVMGYHIYRTKAGSTAKERITAEPIRRTSFTDGSIEPDVPYTYSVRALGWRGLESEPTGPAEATAKFIREPVFTMALEQDVRGLLHGGEVLQGRLDGPAKTDGGVLDQTQGGHVSFPNHGYFALTQPLSVEFWVWFDEPGQIPVVVSCGEWNQGGWFMQSIGGVWRWHVGGVDCDGGKPAEKRWIHVVGTFDGRSTRLFQDGAMVAEKIGSFNTAPWPGELRVGQYSARAGAEFQVTGRIAGVKIYHRPLSDAEVAAAAQTAPQ
ncbi:MAG: LamG-like jellyroll fold domain-containing protein, partial [Planctomycetota bacterium]